MKKGFFCCIALVIMLGAGCTHVSHLTDNMLDWVGGRDNYKEIGDPNLTKRTVIAPFRYGKPDLAPQAKVMQAAVENALTAQPDIIIVDFKELQKASLEFGAAELVTEDRYLAGARHIGLNLVVVGEVTGMYVDYRLMGWYGFRDSLPQLVIEGQVRMVDAIVGTVHSFRSFQKALTLDDIQAQAILTGSKPDPAMVDGLMKSIIDENMPLLIDDLENFAWSGMVLEVNGKQALINGGQDTGLKPGDSLLIYEKTERMLTGGGHSIYPLGRKVGNIVLTQVLAQTAWGEVTFAEQSQEVKPNAPLYDVQPGQLVRTH